MSIGHNENMLMSLYFENNIEPILYPEIESLELGRPVYNRDLETYIKDK